MNQTLPDCNRRGRERRPGFYECSSNRLIHPEAGVVAAETCAICIYRDQPDREDAPPAASPAEAHPLTDPCVHLGEVVDQGTCDICGSRGKPFDIHACELHGRCQKLRCRTGDDAPRACARCSDYRPAGTDDPAPNIEDA